MILCIRDVHHQSRTARAAWVLSWVPGQTAFFARASLRVSSHGESPPVLRSDAGTWSHKTLVKLHADRLGYGQEYADLYQDAGQVDNSLSTGDLSRSVVT